MKKLQTILLCVAALAVVPTAWGRPSGGPGDWVQAAKLTAPDGGGGDWFGYSVALHQSKALIGAPHHDDTLPDQGAAYAFVESAGSWALEEKILPDYVATDNDFGHALSVEGERGLIGAPKKSYWGSHTGLSYIFKRAGTSWSEETSFIAADAQGGDHQGFAVSLSGDTALVASPYAWEGWVLYAGNVNVYRRSGPTQWIQEAELMAGDLQDYASFGYSVSLDGDTALIGAPFEAQAGSPPGSAYVFVRSGSTWTQEAKLTAPDAAVDDKFGWSVSVSGDRALIGKWTTTGAPGAYLYVRSGTTWNLEARLVGDDTVSSDLFGGSIVLRADRALIGAHADGDAGAMSGSAYVFERVGTSWSQRAKLTADDGAAYDFFGCSVSLDEDRALIGAHRDGGVLDFGSAYVFERHDDPGIGYCSGDSAAGASCPCGNENDGTLRGAGCDNGVFPSGALLTGSGLASVTGDTLVLSTVHQEPSNSGLYFQGTTDLSPGLSWGDGLRCTGGAICRLQVRFADAAGSSSTTIPIGAAGGVSAGDTAYYQLWYRTIVNPPCGPGVNDFNSSNGYAITWQP